MLTIKDIEESLNYILWDAPSYLHKVIVDKTNKRVLLEYSNVLLKLENIKPINQIGRKIKKELGFDIYLNLHNPIQNCPISQKYFDYIHKEYKFPEILNSVRSIEYIETLKILLISSNRCGLLIGKGGILIDSVTNSLNVDIRLSEVKKIKIEII